jgi:DNA-binding transcriptional ArsR family regulator
MMCRRKEDDLTRAVAVFRALSDPARLVIVTALLEHGELFQKRLAVITNIEQSLVSRHLRHLRRAGVVAMRREGRFTYLRLLPLPACARAIFERLVW